MRCEWVDSLYNRWQIPAKDVTNAQVPNLALGDFGIPGGVGFIQNGYVSWKPYGKDGKVTFIAGKFGTIYGAEVAESQLNINYSRGMLYNLAQPFFHTGLRADVQVNDYFGFKLIAVNGWNNTIDNNRGKSFGGIVSFTPQPNKSFSLGYLGGPEENDTSTLDCAATNQVFQSGICRDPIGGESARPTSGTIQNPGANGRWRHIVDVMADVTLTPALRVVVNGDFAKQTVVDSATGNESSVYWYGAALFARYQISDVFAVGLRGEIIKDPNGQITAPNTGPLSLATGTLTIDAAAGKYLLIRLDNRIDYADQPVFLSGIRDVTKTQITTTLGVVAKTN